MASPAAVRRSLSGKTCIRNVVNAAPAGDHAGAGVLTICCRFDIMLSFYSFAPGRCVMTYLITGATGPIGRGLVGQLLAAGADVRVTTRNAEAADFPASVDVVGGDFTSGNLP